MAGGTASFSVSPGITADSTNVSMMKLAAAISKTTAAWAVGNGNGGLDTGAITASAFYHVFLIQRVDTGVVDVLFSASATAPTLPANYTLFRRIGSVLTNSSGLWFLINQYGDDFIYSVAQQDINVTTGITPSGSLFALSVPPGIQVVALFRFGFYSANTGARLLIQCPDEVVAIPQAIAGNEQAMPPTAGSAAGGVSAGEARTNTAQQVRVVASVGSSAIQLATFGYRDRRGRDA
jgi:hypothetical protein